MDAPCRSGDQSWRRLKFRSWLSTVAAPAQSMPEPKQTFHIRSPEIWRHTRFPDLISLDFGASCGVTDNRTAVWVQADNLLNRRNLLLPGCPTPGISLWQPESPSASDSGDKIRCVRNIMARRLLELQEHSPLKNILLQKYFKHAAAYSQISERRRQGVRPCRHGHRIGRPRRALDRVAGVSLDSDGPMVTFSNEFYFSGSPSVSPKSTWNALLHNYYT